MNDEERIDKQISEFVKKAPLDKPSAGFTKNVMQEAHVVYRKGTEKRKQILAGAIGIAAFATILINLVFAWNTIVGYFSIIAGFWGELVSHLPFDIPLYALLLIVPFIILRLAVAALFMKNVWLLRSFNR